MPVCGSTTATSGEAARLTSRRESRRGVFRTGLLRSPARTVTRDFAAGATGLTHRPSQGLQHFSHKEYIPLYRQLLSRSHYREKRRHQAFRCDFSFEMLTAVFRAMAKTSIAYVEMYQI